MIPEDPAFYELPGDDMRDHHHPTAGAFSSDALAQVSQALDLDRQLLQVSGIGG